MFDWLVLSFRWCRRYSGLRIVTKMLIRIDTVMAVFAWISYLYDRIFRGSLSVFTIVVTLVGLALSFFIAYLIDILRKCKEFWEVV